MVWAYDAIAVVCGPSIRGSRFSQSRCVCVCACVNRICACMCVCVCVAVVRIQSRDLEDSLQRSNVCRRLRYRVFLHQLSLSFVCLCTQNDAGAPPLVVRKHLGTRGRQSSLSVQHMRVCDGVVVVVVVVVEYTCILVAFGGTCSRSKGWRR